MARVLRWRGERPKRARAGPGVSRSSGVWRGPAFSPRRATRSIGRECSTTSGSSRRRWLPRRKPSRTPARADSANLIAARAYLERYRESAASEDLTNARDHLRSLSTDGFSPTERVEYIIGLGEALFFDGAPGAAAAIFGAVLSGPDYLLAGGARRPARLVGERDRPRRTAAA